MGDDCVLCDPRYGNLCDSVARGEMSKTALAERIDIEKWKVDYHFEKHFDHVEPDPLAVVDKDVDDHVASDNVKIIKSKREILQGKMINLSDRFDDVYNNGKSGSNTSKELVNIATEIRKAVMDIAKLEGELEQEQRITVQNYVDLRSLVLSKLCPDCQQRVMDSLKQEI